LDHFSIILLLTEKCNLRCNYCYETFEYKASNNNQIEKILRLFTTLSLKYPLIDVSFFGGEPMLARTQIRAIIAHNQKLDSEFVYSMTTNGTLLSRDELQFLVDNNLAQCQVTLDGWGKSHDSARHSKNNRATFDKIYNNLLSYREVSGDYTCVIRVNASPTNAPDIPTLAYNITDSFGHDQRFKTFIRRVGKWGGANDQALSVLTSSEFETIEKTFYQIVPKKITL